MLQLKHDCLTLLDHGGLTARGYKDYLFNAIYRLAFECEVLTKFPSVLHTKALLSAARFLYLYCHLLHILLLPHVVKRRSPVMPR